MTIIRFFTLLALIFSASTANAQSYSRVKVGLDEQHNIGLLSQLGIAVDHGEYAAHRHFINDLSGREIAKIRSYGFEVDVLIEDVVTYYQNPNRAVVDRDELCFEQAEKYPVPENFQLGSMAGFYTWEEMLDILDDMQAKYPNLITVKTPIEGQSSHEGRPIYQVKISDHPNSQESEEPEVLYTALHHAREPNSLSQLIYYMWYILEGYDKDDNIRYLVDHTAMYFIPCVNPDGYVYNQVTNPEGGGLWRKNRKVIEGDTLGVDLNRNYGYRWGHDDDGSSPSPASQTYRGHLPFSEPETKAVRDFCNAHSFVAALNYHTYGNLLIYPWGYSDMPPADSSSFFAIAQAMTLANDYLSGTGTNTVGYTTNGDSDDWMYGESESKPSILSMTPEVGTDGFWPAPSNIIPNCQNSMLMNITLAQIPHIYANIKETSPQIINQKMGHLSYQIQRIGLADGDFTVKVIPLSDNIASVGEEKTYTLEANESTIDSIPFLLEESIDNGEDVSFVLELSDSNQSWQDTLYKQFLQLTPIYSETDFDSANLSTELPNSWVVNTGIFHSANNALKESPYAFYPSEYDADVISPPILIPSNAGKSFVQFFAKWDIEKNYDYAQVSLSVNGNNYTPLCGKYSSKGTIYQDTGNPIYDGQQAEWVLESIEITDLVSPTDEIRVKFEFHSDTYVEGEGMYIDDLKVGVLSSIGIAAQNPVPQSFTLGQNIPNPAQNRTQITISSQDGTFSERKLLVFNVLGALVFEEKLSNRPIETVDINTSKWKSGVYFYRLQTDRLFSPWKKIIITK